MILQSLVRGLRNASLNMVTNYLMLSPDRKPANDTSGDEDDSEESEED